ncbi:MAG: LytTR family DNA-binding domain-containing protein [Eubacterium sp.]
MKKRYLQEFTKKTSVISEIEALVNSVDSTAEIIGYCDGDIKILSIEEIECICVENDKTYAYCTDSKQYRVKGRLYEVEKLLPPNFIKINKSAIANKKQIQRFKAQISGAVDIDFKSGKTEYVSRRCFKESKRRLGL